MEELAVYAILCSVGYDFNKEYNKALDKLFLENQKNNDYLELEGMQQKDAILHTLSIMNAYSLKQNLSYLAGRNILAVFSSVHKFS